MHRKSTSNATFVVPALLLNICSLCTKEVEVSTLISIMSLMFQTSPSCKGRPPTHFRITSVLFTARLYLIAIVNVYAFLLASGSLCYRAPEKMGFLHHGLWLGEGRGGKFRKDICRLWRRMASAKKK